MAKAVNVQSIANSIQGCCEAPSTPHAFNLLHQVQITSKKNVSIAAELIRIVPAYLEFVEALRRFDYDNVKVSSRDATDAVENYIALVMEVGNAVFRSQSDFRTSIMPEFFLRILSGFLLYEDHPFSVVGQTDIPIDIAFDLKREGLIVPKLQRIDVAVVHAVELSAAGAALNGFCIPIIGAEVKNYFDKNMISGVEYSVGSMKNTFPHCLYFAIGEFADFSLDAFSYASTYIDEIFILRKQKRPDFRKTGIAKEISADLIEEILSRFFSAIRDHRESHKDLSIRVPHGRLIRGNPWL